MVNAALFFVLFSILIAGCAEIEPLTPDKMSAPWTSAALLRLGDSKDLIKSKWGEPDEVRRLGKDDIGLVKEEWYYRGSYPVVPADDKYLFKAKRLVFTGDSLTSYEVGEKAPLPQND